MREQTNGRVDVVPCEEWGPPRGPRSSGSPRTWGSACSRSKRTGGTIYLMVLTDGERLVAFVRAASGRFLLLLLLKSSVLF